MKENDTTTADLAEYLADWRDTRSPSHGIVTPEGMVPITIPAPSEPMTLFADAIDLATMARHGRLTPAPDDYVPPKPKPRRRPIGSAAMTGTQRPPLTIDPAAVPWASVPAFTSGIAEWIADAHLTATGRTEGTAEWVAQNTGKTRGECRAYISGSSRWPLHVLARLLDALCYEGRIVDEFDALTITTDGGLDDTALSVRVIAWMRRCMERRRLEWSATELHRALTEDAKRYGDVRVDDAPRGVAMVSTQQIHSIMTGTSKISVPVLYRFCRLINARGLWDAPTLPAVAMPGGLVTRRMAWSGEPMRNSRIPGIEPSPAPAQLTSEA